MTDSSFASGGQTSGAIALADHTGKGEDCPRADPDDVRNCICLPASAAITVRQRLGLQRDEPLRLAFLGGPGDVQGSFDHWAAGRLDPRVPVISYSTMFFELVRKLDAEAMVIIDTDKQPATSVAAFQFVHVPHRPAVGSLRYWAEGLRYSTAVVRQLRAFAPHAVIIGPHPAVLMALLPRSIRIVLTSHNTYWPMGRRPGGVGQKVKLALYGLGLKWVSAGVCTSPECLRQTAQLRGSAQGLFVEMPQVLAGNVNAASSPVSLRRLLYLGRLEVDKGIFDLLDVFESLASEYVQLTLDFAGAGSSAGSLVARIQASRCSERIRYLGQLSGRGVHAALDAADLLICPTKSAFNEGLALVVVEAAAHGVPALLSSVVPAKELVDGACVEFPADDVGALRSCLKAMIDEPESFRSLRARASGSSAVFGDRTKSWGTQVYRALVC